MARSVRRSIIALVLVAAGIGLSACTSPSGGGSVAPPVASAQPPAAPPGY